ncbi:hypothetical protein GCM10025868_26370 [Angustibacter aerolatus]|uniref:GntR C-terminal domain-containing protein n=1 Tax=Angustibacter aerolatus TaxID=1162965 RepID=A0ABQ6JGM4_9ACTN|nr:hypothetical protein GCM10025868_26370 [Angustibacter aerolatus]
MLWLAHSADPVLRAGCAAHRTLEQALRDRRPDAARAAVEQHVADLFAAARALRAVDHVK